MELNDVSRLASYLHSSGDQILSGAKKFTISSALLHKLNEAFHLIVEKEDSVGSSEFQVVNTNNANFDILRDLAFLHDFVQKTLSLKIIIRLNEEVSNVDISKFCILKHLEISKLPISMVSGIECVLEELDTLVCYMSLSNVKDVLEVSDPDNGSRKIWVYLRKAVLSYNALETLDQSLKYAPFIQILNLSHNRLIDANAIVFLPNLKCLNLSFNHLSAIPTLNKAATNNLLSLTMKFNMVEDLSGLANLGSLKELDLSCNCLTTHTSVLRPMLQLRSLMWLSLDGNPLSYHTRHRVLTAQSLHINTINMKFLLNGVPLSKSERLVVGTLDPCTSVVVEPLDPSTDKPLLSGAAQVSASELVISEASSVATRSQSHAKRGGKVREALIFDHQDKEEENLSSFLSSSLESSTEHLTTKKQIESLREKFGPENWLHSHGGSFVQSVLGLAQSPQTSILDSLIVPSTSEPEDKVFDMHQQCMETVGGPGGDQVAESIVTEELVKSTDSMFSPTKDTSTQQPASDVSSDEDEDEIDKHVYPVQRIDSAKQHNLFLVVTKTTIKEREISYGKTCERWTVASLTSCVNISNEPSIVHLTFDTIRKDRQERKYVMDVEDTQSIIRALGAVLDSRSLSAMHQSVFRCLNCSSQFSLEVDSWRDELSRTKRQACPNCLSELVIEVEDNSLADSPSQTSIGPVGLLSPGVSELLRVSAITVSPGTPRDKRAFTPITTRSSASLDVSPEYGNTRASHVVKRSDSDIEILSNPSQSSIEVLNDFGTPVRKHSEERSLTAVTETKLQLLSLNALTESSSSGSFTDSICTAYDSKQFSGLKPNSTSTPKSLEKNESRPFKQVIEYADSLDKPDADNADNASSRRMGNAEGVGQNPFAASKSVLEGLLTSVSAKFSRTSLGELAVADTNHVQYNYKDFAQVDHRVKLHLHVRVFVEGTEQLQLLAKGIVMHSTTDWYTGFVVMSDKTVYLLKVTGVEGDEPENWLTTLKVLPLSHLTTVQALPWNQGISLEFNGTDGANSMLLVLHDRIRTENLLSFISGLELDGLKVHLSTMARMQDEGVTQMAVFQRFQMASCVDNHEELELGLLLVTKNNITLSKDLHALFPQSALPPPYLSQSLSNLLDVEVCNRMLSLHFYDETSDQDETWMLFLETQSSIEELVSGISLPWEDLFLVPLQVTHIE